MRLDQVGRDQGTLMSAGYNCGCFSNCHNCCKVRLNLSCSKKWWGGLSLPSHLLSASARSLDFPGMWDTSTSRLELEINRLNFSRKRAIGSWVENNLLVNDSAVVLSDSIGMRIGIRAPGQNLVTTKTNANCARVSKQPISF